MIPILPVLKSDMGQSGRYTGNCNVVRYVLGSRQCKLLWECRKDVSKDLAGTGGRRVRASGQRGLPRGGYI